MTKPFKFFKSNLRISILVAFSVVLFLSFALIWTVLSIALNQYIQSSAEAVLDEARVRFYYRQMDFIHGNRSIFIALGGQQGLFRTSLNSFIVNERYEPIGNVITASSAEIADMLRQIDLPPNSVNNLQLRTADGAYFFASAFSMGLQERYTIFYVDVTDLQSFTHIINRMLLLLAIVTWLVAVVVTGFLADALAKPLRILQGFAKQIGKGDFTPNPTHFVNEEFEALNSSLNHTAGQLAKYDNDQKIFFQNASHELRTPLMTIKSYTEGIKYGIMDSAKATQTILEASDRLSAMVDDILYISRIDNITNHTLENVDITALIQERILLQRPLAELKNIEINFNTEKDSITLNCASSYIGRAIDNLISNAIRFAQKTIDIECKLDGNSVLIMVSDDGPGFEPNVLPQVFERFFKGKNGLTGIGLSVVRTISEQHKGTALAHNKPHEQGTGAVLTICIPNNL